MQLNFQEKELLKKVFKLAREGVNTQLQYAISMYDAELEDKTLLLEKEIQELQARIFPKG